MVAIFDGREEAPLDDGLLVCGTSEAARRLGVDRAMLIADLAEAGYVERHERGEQPAWMSDRSLLPKEPPR
jgi:hypothetical protein